MEYSARNRHCLVEMEMDGGQLWDSICVSDKEELNTEGSLSAIAALVKVGHVDTCMCVCNYFLSLMFYGFIS